MPTPAPLLEQTLVTQTLVMQTLLTRTLLASCVNQTIVWNVRLFKTLVWIKRLLALCSTWNIIASTRDETSRFTLCIHREHPWNISVEQILAHQCQVTSVPRALCGTLRTVIRPGHLRLCNPKWGSGWKFPTHLLDREKLHIDQFQSTWVFFTP